MDSFLGQITLFAFNFAPRGWAPCEGQMLPINQNQALFALIGTNFGGDGQTAFALPDMRGQAPNESMLYCIAFQGEFPSRAEF